MSRSLWPEHFGLDTVISTILTSTSTAVAAWRSSWHCLSGKHRLCLLFSWPELRKTACAGRFESCGCQLIILKDNSVASRTMDLRVATATSKATATRSRIVLKAWQFTCEWAIWTRENVIGKVFPVRTGGIIKSRLLKLAKLYYSFIIVLIRYLKTINIRE